MKILVTGSAGFIGYHLTEKLLAMGYSVVGIDSINDYYDVNLKFARLSSAGIDCDNISYNHEVISEKNKLYSFYKLNLEDNEALLKIFKDKQFDAVINLAAQAGVRYSLENPHAYISSNVLGFLNILECCRMFQIQHLLYASSSSVYGMNNQEVFAASDSVDHPVSLYAATKRSNELMAHVYSNLYDLPTTGLRFFTVYGPWGRPDMAPMLFTKAIMEGSPIKVFNHGNMIRDFTYIDDIVEGIVAILTNEPPKGNPEEFRRTPNPSFSYAAFQIFNIGNNSPVHLMDFINLIETETGKNAIKNFMDIQPGDVYKTYADVTPLTKYYNYKPSTKLDHGVKEFVKWYLAFYNTDQTLL